jgi:ABC-type nitrate/sulfonate/bicarbonate transport system permease component
MSSPLLPVLNTLFNILFGAIAAAIVGIPVGVVLGLFKPVYQVAKRILQIPASVPTVTLLPLLLAIFQTTAGIGLNLFLVFFPMLWWVSLYSAMGVQRSQEKKQWWLAIPDITQGIRVGLIFAWTAVIFADMLTGQGGQSGGIGFYIWDVYNSGQQKAIQMILGAIIAITFVVFIIDQVIDVIGMALMQAFKPRQSSQTPPQ